MDVYTIDFTTAKTEVLIPEYPETSVLHCILEETLQGTENKTSNEQQIILQKKMSSNLNNKSKV